VISGWKLWYDERLILEHFMPLERLNKEYAEKLFKAQENSSRLIKNLRFYSREKLFFEENSLQKIIYNSILRIDVKTMILILKRSTGLLIMKRKLKKGNL
jgi:hypothetical protein